MRWTQMLTGVVLVILLALIGWMAMSRLAQPQQQTDAGSSADQPIKLARLLPKYQPIELDKVLEAFSGDLNVAGSGSGNSMMILWAEGFQKYYPDVHILIESKGSSTAIPALIAGTAQLGILSRRIKAAENNRFNDRYGYKPMEVLVAIDALAVYVNQANPLEELTLQQVDGIFSSTLKRGGKHLRTWGDLGLTGEWTNQLIHLYSTLSQGGTYSVFRDKALQWGEYKDTVQELPGLASVVQGIIVDRFAIGFSSIAYSTAEVKPLKLAKSLGERYYEASVQALLEGTYALTRYFYLYANKAPEQPLGPLVREFLRFVLSREGQESVSKAGYIPLPGTLAIEQLESMH